MPITKHNYQVEMFRGLMNLFGRILFLKKQIIGK